MKNLEQIITTMDLNFFGTGQHKITFDKMMELYKEDKVYILDVRTKEEQEYVVLPFTINIPLHEISNNLDKLPKDKIIALFCTSCSRAVIAYTYLLSVGYEPKILSQHLGDFVDNFKPGYVRKHINK